MLIILVMSHVQTIYVLVEKVLNLYIYTHKRITKLWETEQERINLKVQTPHKFGYNKSRQN